MKRQIELPELGIIKTNKERITLEDMDNVERLREEGYKFTQIDAAYCRQPGTISRFYRKWKNGEFFGEKSANEFDSGKLGALLRAGWKIKDIATEFKMSEPEIEKRIKELDAACKG